MSKRELFSSPKVKSFGKLDENSSKQDDNEFIDETDISDRPSHQKRPLSPSPVEVASSIPSMSSWNFEGISKKAKELTSSEVLSAMTIPHSTINISREDLDSLIYVGKLESDFSMNFLFQSGDSLMLFDYIKAEEALLYEELKKDYELKREAINPIEVQVEKSLLQSIAKKKVFSHPQFGAVVKKNGFDIKITSGVMSITAVTSEIPNYGEKDMLELLQYLDLQSLDLGLEYFRPTRVLEHLKYVAERAMDTKRKSAVSIVDVRETISKLKISSSWISFCPHGFKIFTPL